MDGENFNVNSMVYVCACVFYPNRMIKYANYIDICISVLSGLCEIGLSY